MALTGLANDTFDARFEFVEQLLKNNKVEPMINLSPCDTETFNAPTGEKINNDSDNSNDTRYRLNKNLHDFCKVINDIGGKLLYIKSGSTGHTFKGITTLDNGETVNYAVKVVAYPKHKKYGDMHDVSRPENAELCMIKCLSYFVVKKQTPHIVLPIGTFDTSIKPFTDLIEKGYVDKSNDKYQEFIQKYKDDKYYNQVSVLLSEWANKGDLLDFVRKNYKEFSLTDWKVIFFQIISVLAVIQNKYPSFRHNDLKANNILVHKTTKRNANFIYTVNKKKYTIPNIGYRIKLWDFDFACIPGIVDNIKVGIDWTNAINVKPEQNRYYDMHYFFNTLGRKGFFPQLKEDKCVPKEVNEFIQRIIPSEYEASNVVHERGRLLVNVEYVIPDTVLKNDPFFAEFRN